MQRRPSTPVADLQCALAGNTSADVGPLARERLVELSQSVAALRAPLARHPRLTPDLGAALYAWVGETLRAALAERFSVDERLSWVDSRLTTEEEDIAYCMLGIFGVSLMVNYGEGRDKALQRLQEEIKEQRCHLSKGKIT